MESVQTQGVLKKSGRWKDQAFPTRPTQLKWLQLSRQQSNGSCWKKEEIQAMQLTETY